MRAIACVDKNMGLGKDGKLIVNSKKDMAYFKNKTMGNPVVMGRKTFESMGSRPLKGRTNIVISSSDIDNEDVVSFHSVDEFVSSKYNDDDTFVIGGSTIYAQLLPYVNEIYLTEVDISLPADTFFQSLRSSLFLRKRSSLRTRTWLWSTASTIGLVLRCLNYRMRGGCMNMAKFYLCLEGSAIFLGGGFLPGNRKFL